MPVTIMSKESLEYVRRIQHEVREAELLRDVNDLPDDFKARRRRLRDSLTGKARHPGYARAHPYSQYLHDRIECWICDRFHCELEKTNRKLVFRGKKRFCAIQSVLIKRPSITVSVLVRPDQHPDTALPLKRGQYCDWREIEIVHDDQLDALFSIIARAERL